MRPRENRHDAHRSPKTMLIAESARGRTIAASNWSSRGHEAAIYLSRGLITGRMSRFTLRSVRACRFGGMFHARVIGMAASGCRMHMDTPPSHLSPRDIVMPMFLGGIDGLRCLGRNLIGTRGCGEKVDVCNDCRGHNNN